VLGVETETEHAEVDVNVEAEMNAELEALSGCRQEPQLERRRAAELHQPAASEK
jgi:hypothetical protein